MFSVFMELVKRVGVFVIIGQTILHFGISKKYEKYMKLVISFMVGAQIFFAFGIYLEENDKPLSMISSEEYLQAWKIHMKKMEHKIEESKRIMLQDIEIQMQQSEKVSTSDIPSPQNKIEIDKIRIP